MIFKDLSSVVSEIGKTNGSTGTFMFWLVTIFTTIWTVNWIINKSTRQGYLRSFIRLVSMWVLVMYFFINRDVSRVHLIWVAPTIYFLGLSISRLLKKAITGGDG